MVDISHLSDKELRAVLKDHGQNPGPITGTTRRVYELQLQSILSGSSPKSARAAEKKKRRQTLDTLRTTEKPKLEPRRSEKLLPRRPVIPASLNFSDSDSEIPELNLSPETETPEPPQSLVFSNSPRPSRRRSLNRDGRPDLSLFSDEESDKNAKAKKKVLKKPPQNSKTYTCALVLSMIVVIAGVGIAYYTLEHKTPEPSVAPVCLNLTFELDVNTCDKLFQQFVKQKQEFDVTSGEVICGDREGDLYRQAPDDVTERRLLFDLRGQLNYSIYLQKDDIYLEIEGESELSSFDPEREPFFYRTLTPYITWFCCISSILSNFAFYIVISVGILVMAQIAHKVYQWKRSKEKQEMGQMFELIDQIIEELQRNYSKYQTDPINYVPYVAIPHARDRLLLPSERTAMKHIWERAVQFIAQHESRVRVEMRRVQSEDFPVWYWLEASKSPPVQPDSTSPDFLYPDLDAEIPLEKGKTSIGS